MISRYEYKNLVWVDLESPTPDEVRSIVDEFQLHPKIGERFLLNTKHTESEKFRDHLYLVLHLPAFQHSKGTVGDQEIDIVIGKNFLITNRYDTIDALSEFTKIFETNAVIHSSDMGAHAGFIFFYMMRHLYNVVLEDQEYLADELREIEGHIFAGREKEMVERISKASRSALTSKRILRSHSSILATLRSSGKELFGTVFGNMTEILSIEHEQLTSDIAAHSESVTELRETNNSLVSTKQNEVTQKLTLMAFITFPLTLLAAVFAIDVPGKPYVNDPEAFWHIIALMIATAAFFFAYFRYKNWI